MLKEKDWLSEIVNKSEAILEIIGKPDLLSLDKELSGLSPERYTTRVREYLNYVPEADRILVKIFLDNRRGEGILRREHVPHGKHVRKASLSGPKKHC